MKMVRSKRSSLHTTRQIARKLLRSPSHLSSLARRSLTMEQEALKILTVVSSRKAKILSSGEVIVVLQRVVALLVEIFRSLNFVCSSLLCVCLSMI